MERNSQNFCLRLLPAHDVLEQLAGRQLAQHLPIAVGEDGICIPWHPMREESKVKGWWWAQVRGQRWLHSLGLCIALFPVHPQRELEPGLDNLFGAQSLSPSQRWQWGLPEEMAEAT